MQVWQARAEGFAEFVARSAGRLVALTAADGGKRRPMGWLREVFFLGMVEELQARGVSRKVTADMLGVSRRTLLRQIDAAEHAVDLRRRSVWLRVYQLAEREPVNRQDVAAACRTVAPRTLASVVADMVKNGWLAERTDGRLTARSLDRERTDAEIAAYLDVLQRTDAFLALEAIARELQVSEERVRAHTGAHADRRFHWRADENNRWMALEIVADRAFRFLRGRLTGPAQAYRGGVWTLRADRLSPEQLAELRAEVQRAVTRLGEASAALADPSELWPKDRAMWTAAVMECCEPGGGDNPDTPRDPEDA